MQRPHPPPPRPRAVGRGGGAPPAVALRAARGVVWPDALAAAEARPRVYFCNAEMLPRMLGGPDEAGSVGLRSRQPEPSGGAGDAAGPLSGSGHGAGRGTGRAAATPPTVTVPLSSESYPTPLSPAGPSHQSPCASPSGWHSARASRVRRSGSR